MSWFDQRPDDAMDGAFTVVGPEPVRTVEAAIFREAMSRLGAAVHVVTTAGSAGKTGATATAVCSVSDAPPTLLICLNRRSQTNPAVVENGVFCVNTLGAGGAEIADIFAGRTGVRGLDRFATGEWTVLATGSPVLASAVVVFDCRVIEVRAVASHNVFFGAVEAVRLGPAGPALVYHERAYKRV
jgi:flavin reductase